MKEGLVGYVRGRCVTVEEDWQEHFSHIDVKWQRRVG